MQLLSLLIALCIAGLYLLRPIRRLAAPWENRLRLATRRPAMGWVAAAGLSLIWNLAIVLHAGIPQPRIHDEFSYLLAADTFAHGRLTNPTHPLWPFFVTFHELQRPSYMSKYPPAQGLLLAAGQVLDGLPILGAWLGAAALCVAGGWALAAFVSPTWSVLGALLLAIHPLIAQWSQTYWGGLPAAIGGALVLGAWGRLGWRRSTGRVGAAVALGVGVGILAMSRPYEGGVLALVAAVWIAASGGWRALAVAAVAAAPMLAWLGYYNDRVTGSPTRWPYLVYERQYAAAPPLLWLSLRTPSQQSTEPGEMRQYADTVEVPHFLAQRSVGGFLSMLGSKLAMLAKAVAEPWIVVVAAAAAAATARDRRLWAPTAGVAAVLAATAASNWTRPQYVAPATAAVAVLLIAGAAAFTRRWPAAGRGLLAGIVCGAVGLGWTQSEPGSAQFQRGTVLASLQQLGGKHLVLVQYLPGHRLDDEWVFNDADIDAAAVVWAHDLGWPRDRALVNYFANRELWRLQVNATSATLQRIDPRSGDAVP